MGSVYSTGDDGISRCDYCYAPEHFTDSDAAAKIARLERERDGLRAALEDATQTVMCSPLRWVGDHQSYTAQISEAQVQKWRDMLDALAATGGGA